VKPPTWTVLYTAAAERDVKAIRKRYPHLETRLIAIDAQLRHDPHAPGQGYHALLGDLSGHYSRRLDGFHRVVYRIERPDVVVVSCLGHYGDS
jgi:Txe/YoeB family toxin of toxin-antitoxin system